MYNFYREVRRNLHRKYLEYVLSRQKAGEKTDNIDIFVEDSKEHLRKSDTLKIGFFSEPSKKV